jgi:acetyl esterase/lipase
VGLELLRVLDLIVQGLPRIHQPVSATPVPNSRRILIKTFVTVNRRREYHSSSSSLTNDSYPQQGFPSPTNFSEDCLSLNIARPTNARNLPVAVWIYGGAFAIGSSSQSSYNLSNFVDASVRANKPLVAVSLNYRSPQSLSYALSLHPISLPCIRDCCANVCFWLNCRLESSGLTIVDCRILGS